MGVFYWAAAMVLTAMGDGIEASIWMLMAVVAWSSRDIIAAIRKGAN